MNLKLSTILFICGYLFIHIKCENNKLKNKINELNEKLKKYSNNDTSDSNSDSITDSNKIQIENVDSFQIYLYLMF